MYLIDFLVIYLLFLESLFYKISTLVPATAFGIANITPQSKKVLYNSFGLYFGREVQRNFFWDDTERDPPV